MSRKMMRFDDDDDDFNVPQSSSKLAALFSHDNQPVTDDSFKYKAPKDPNRKSQFVDETKKEKSPPKTTLLCAYSGHCFKLVNGQYSESQKLGVAIIGEVHNNLFSILLYITKDKPISFTRIINSTSVEVGNRNFVSFKDDAGEFWSVGFAKEEEVVGFTKQVALARWMSGNGTKLLTQDLLMGEGCVIDPGDLVEVKVTKFRLVTEGVLILDPVGEELVKFKVGKRAVPQEESVIGMKKMGQRLIFYSRGDSSQSSSAGSSDQGDKSLEVTVEEITVMRVKFAKGKEPPKDGDKLPIESSTFAINEQESLPHSRSATTSNHVKEQLTESKSLRTNQEKAVLMDRIKKLGQPMLPVTKVASYTDDPEECDGSGWSPRSNNRPSPESMDDKEGEVVLSQVLIKPDIRPKPGQVTRVFHDNRPMQDYQLQRPSSSITTFSPFMTGSTIPHSHSPDPTISLMMLDMKQQSIDLRSLLLRTSDKIEALGSKVDDIQKTCSNTFQQQQSLMASSSSPPSFSSPLLQCEVKVIAQSINKIFEDNEELRKELKDRDMRIGNLTQKINEVYESNQRFIQSHTESNSSVINNKKLLEENTALKVSIEETKAQLSKVKNELATTKQDLVIRSSEVIETRLRLDEMQAKMSTMQDEMNAKASKEMSELKEEMERLKESRDEVKGQLESERKERNIELQEKKTKIVEYDRIVCDLRETLMRKNNVNMDSKAAIKELEREFKDRLSTREEFHGTLAKSWQDERINLVNKLSELEKNHHLKINEIIKQKNGEMQVIKEEMMKMSQEYNIIKALAKDLKEKYNLSLKQHDDHLEQNTAKIKGLMNNIYRSFKEDFITGKTYLGTHVLRYASQIIKSKTLEMMGNNNANQNNLTAASSLSSSLMSLDEDFQSKPPRVVVSSSPPRVVVSSSPPPVVVSSSPPPVVVSSSPPPVVVSSSPPPVVVSSSPPPVVVSSLPPPVTESLSSVTPSLLSNSTFALSSMVYNDGKVDDYSGEDVPNETRTQDKDGEPIIGREKQVMTAIGGEGCGASESQVDTSNEVSYVPINISLVDPDIDPCDVLTSDKGDDDVNLKVESHVGEVTNSDDSVITNNKKLPTGSDIDSVLTNENEANKEFEESLHIGMQTSTTLQDGNDDDSIIKPPPFPDDDDDDDWNI